MNSATELFNLPDVMRGYLDDFADYDDRLIIVTFTWENTPGCAYDNLQLEYKVSDMTTAELSHIENYLVMWFFENFKKIIKE